MRVYVLKLPVLSHSVTASAVFIPPLLRTRGLNLSSHFVFIHLQHRKIASRATPVPLAASASSARMKPHRAATSATARTCLPMPLSMVAIIYVLMFSAPFCSPQCRLQTHSEGFGQGAPLCFDEYCGRNPCKNGGTCINQKTSFTCECHPAFEGPTCEENVNECLSSPCQNGFECVGMYLMGAVATSGVLSVQHVAAFDSRRTTLLLDENDINGYRCDCGDTGDFSGKNCEIVEPCTPNPCLNGGSCSYTPEVLPGKYTCTW